MTQANFCFCDDPLDQPGITYMYHMLISNNVWANPWPGPWQWTVDNSSRSTLLDPASPSFMRLKTMIEEAVRGDTRIYGTCSFFLSIERFITKDNVIGGQQDV